MKKTAFILIMTVMFLAFPSIGIAADKVDQMVRNVSFMSPTKEEVLENGVIVQWINLIVDSTPQGGESPEYYSVRPKILFGITKSNFFYKVIIKGVTLSINNKSDKILVIKWSESALSVGSFSGIPCLSEMSWRDAGNPSATPDTVLAPGQSIKKYLYLSSSSFSSYFVGEPIRKDGSTKITLVMKMQTGNNPTAQYYTIISPPVTTSV